MTPDKARSHRQLLSSRPRRWAGLGILGADRCRQAGDDPADAGVGARGSKRRERRTRWTCDSRRGDEQEATAFHSAADDRPRRRNDRV